jgi:hypothetical protein
MLVGFLNNLNLRVHRASYTCARGILKGFLFLLDAVLPHLYLHVSIEPLHGFLGDGEVLLDKSLGG